MIQKLFFSCPKFNDAHGGKREGAGRKPKPEHLKYNRISITLPQEMHEWLKRQPDGISGTIQNLIKQARQ